MDFMQLIYFQAVAQTNNITKAAEKLYISQPALSQMILKLEEELSVPLFFRRPKGVQLTDAGKLFLEYTNRTLSDKKEILQKLKDTKTEVSGEILLQANAISYIIAELFCDFKRIYPNTKIRFVTNSDLRQNIYQSDPFSSVDLFITAQLPAAEYSSSSLLFKEEFLAALPLDHNLAEKDSLSLLELRDEPFLLFQGGELQKLTENYCVQAGFSPNILMECHNTNILFNLVSLGMGVSLFPKSWEMFNNRKIKLIPLKEQCVREVYLCWSNSRYLNKAADLFREYLIEKMDI